jgi:hypothetical protein
VGDIKTPVAARHLGMPYWHLIDLIRFDKIAAPARDSSRHYVWTPEDVERARQVIEARRGQRQEAARAS